VRFHLEMCEADLLAAGFPPDAARAEARRRFGDPDATAAECVAIERERRGAARRLERLAALGHDVALAARTLRRAPAFTLTAVLTLGLGVGATTALFGVADAVLFRPLPLPHAERLTASCRRSAARRAAARRRCSPRGGAEPPRAGHRRGARARRHARRRRRGGARGGARRERPLLRRARPRAAGRARARPADDAPGAAPAVVLGHRLWVRRFAGAPDALGRALVLDGVPHTVVGVMPPTLDAVLGRREFVVPLQLAASQRTNFTPYLTLLGRLAPGASRAAAATELAAITAGLGPDARVDGATQGVRVEPLDRTLAADVRQPLLLMLGAVGALLAIACANVGHAGARAQRGAVARAAVRAALGAGRGRLLTQLAAEHLVLALLAALVAVPVAVAGTPALAAALAAAVPRRAAARHRRRRRARAARRRAARPGDERGGGHRAGAVPPAPRRARRAAGGRAAAPPTRGATGGAARSSPPRWRWPSCSSSAPRCSCAAPWRSAACARASTSRTC
jgi:hypothetical protein